VCPECKGQQVTRNGKLSDGRQNFKCKSCGRQFIEHPKRRRIDPEIKAIIMRLIAEDVSPAKIARAIPLISKRWVYELKGKKN